MQVLCFAHRLEAIRFFDTEPCQNLSANLFQFKNFYILLTGEGLQSATETLVAFLATHPEVSTVVNLGVAAGNPQVLKLGSVYSIRTLYRQKSTTQMAFTSFTTNDATAFTDLVSCEDRIHSTADAAALFIYAASLDREAWALASACKRFKKDFYCFKYISDDATKEACSQIKEIASSISEALLQKYLSFAPSHRSLAKFELPVGYHFTFTQKAEFEKLLPKVASKEAKSVSDILGSLPTFTASKPKDLSKLLLAHLHERLDPFTYKIRGRLDATIATCNQDDVKITYDRSLESDAVEILMRVNDAKDLEQKMKHVTAIPFEKIARLLRGENVE